MTSASSILLSLLVISSSLVVTAVAEEAKGASSSSTTNTLLQGGHNVPFKQATAPKNVYIPSYNFGLPHPITHVAKMGVSFTARGSETLYEGDIIFGFYGTIVPKTVKNFVDLCNHEHGFGYRNSTFHRILRNFVVQGGDFETNEGFGGHSIYNEKGSFADESYLITHSQGAVAMAAEGYEENGSQFYIMVGEDTTYLDGIHVVFGHVLSGFKDVVRKMGTVAVDFQDKPKNVVRITSCVAGEHDEEARVPKEERQRRAKAAAEQQRRRRGRHTKYSSSSASDDPTNKRVQGPRRPHDQPHRSQRHRDAQAKRMAEFEKREHERREKMYGERDAPRRRDAMQRKAFASEEAHEKRMQKQKERAAEGLRRRVAKVKAQEDGSADSSKTE